MTHFYLSAYRGSGISTADPFLPHGFEVPGASAIDLRPDDTRVEGRCLLATPTRLADESAVHYVGDDPDAPLPTNIRRRIENALSLTFDSADDRWRRIVPALLLKFAGGSRWKPLKEARDGHLRIWLGGLFWTMPVPAGGATITESFNKADADTLGPDLTWTEHDGDIDVVTNRAESISTSENRATAQTALSTDDHYAQALMDSRGAERGGVIARDTNSATLTYYYADVTNRSTLFKRVSSSFTSLGTGSTFTLPKTIRLECDGSSITFKVDGVTAIGPVTDTAITGNTHVGIRAFNAGAQWESFEAGDLGAGDTPVAGAKATETDTGNAGTIAATITGSQATETDTANTGSVDQAVNGAQAAEADTAFAGTVSIAVTGSQATETDSGRAGTIAATVTGTLATETDTGIAGSVTTGATVTGGRATETDSAFAGSVSATVDGSRATETDTAFAGSTTGGATSAYEVDPVAFALHGIISTRYKA